MAKKRKSNKLVYGVGITDIKTRDADYNVKKKLSVLEGYANEML